MKKNDNTWIIIDDEGIINSGNEEEMTLIFTGIQEDPDMYDKHIGNHEGDLRLMEEHGIYR